MRRAKPKPPKPDAGDVLAVFRRHAKAHGVSVDEYVLAWVQNILYGLRGERRH